MNKEKSEVLSGVDPEGEVSEGIGVILIIFDRKSLYSDDPRFWTVTELTSKPETGKTAGQVSVPAETKKEGEEIVPNIFGGIAEFTDSDQIVSSVFIHPERFYARNAVSVLGRGIDVAFMVLDDKVGEEIKPLSDSDVEPRGWMSISEATRLNGELRSIASDSISFAIRHDVIHSLQDDGQLVPITSLIEDELSLSERNKSRETKSDIQLN